MLKWGFNFKLSLIMKILSNKYRHHLVGLSIIAYFFYSIMQLSLFNILSPYLLNQLKFSHVEIGFLSSTYLYALALTLIPAGYLLDKYGARKLSIITFSLSVISTLILAFSHAIVPILIYRVVTGIANGVAFLASLRVAYYWFANHRAFASGVIIAAGMSGGFIASILFAYLSTYSGWDNTLFFNVGCGIFMLLLVVTFLHDHPNEVRKSDLSWNNFKEIFRNSQNWLCGSYTGLLNLSVYILAALWGNSYLISRYKFDMTTAASITAMIFIGIIIGSPIWGWMSDRFEDRRVPMLIGATLSSFVMIAIIYIDTRSMFILGALFLSLGLMTSSQVISYPIIASSNQPGQVSLATSFAALIINIIGAVSQPIFGWTLSITHESQLSLFMLLIAFILSAFIVLFIRNIHDIDIKS